MPIIRRVLLCTAVILFLASVSEAQREYFSPDGTRVSSSEKQATPPKKKETYDQRLRRSAEAAAAAGYKVGDTVAEKNGIIYKLAIDPKTKTYTFKRYRRVKRKPAAAAAVKGTGVKSPAAQPGKGLEKKADTPTAKQAETAQARNEQIEAEKRAIRKAEASAEQAEKRRRLAGAMDRGTLRVGRILQAGQLGVYAEHRFIKRKTVLNSRTVTTASGTVSDNSMVGVKDLFTTDIHTDLFTLAYGLGSRLECFVQAGMIYETLSDISDAEFGYGGGLRLSLWKMPINRVSGVYLDGTGRYFSGNVTGNFTDPLGDAYDKSSDFTETEIGIEAGYSRADWSLFAGLSYGMYSEETVKEQYEDPTNFTLLNDDMESQDNVLLRLGGEYLVTPSLRVYLEGQVLFGEGLVAGLSYRF